MGWEINYSEALRKTRPKTKGVWAEFHFLIKPPTPSVSPPISSPPQMLGAYEKSYYVIIPLDFNPVLVGFFSNRFDPRFMKIAPKDHT